MNRSHEKLLTDAVLDNMELRAQNERVMRRMFYAENANRFIAGTLILSMAVIIGLGLAS